MRYSALTGTLITLIFKPSVCVSLLLLTFRSKTTVNSNADISDLLSTKSSRHCQMVPPVIHLQNFTTVSRPQSQIFRDKPFRTPEAEAKIMTSLIAPCHRGLSLGYTCYEKASYAILNTRLTGVMQVGGRLVTPLPKNKSCEASCLCIACYECRLPSL